MKQLREEKKGVGRQERRERDEIRKKLGHRRDSEEGG